MTNPDQAQGTHAEAGFTPLADVAALDAALARSQEAPVLIFLNDPYCPISRHAWGEMQRLPQESLTDAYLVDVSRQHDVKRAVAEKTAVRHESPQAIVLRQGKAVWDASHFAITAKEVSTTLAANR